MDFSRRHSTVPVPSGLLLQRSISPRPGHQLPGAGHHDGPDVSTLFKCFGAIPRRRGDAASFRLRSSGNQPAILAGQQSSRPLAPHQYLLERLHGEGRLLSGLFQTAQEWGPSGSDRSDGRRLRGYLVFACLPVFLADRQLGHTLDGYDLLDDSRDTGPRQYAL